MNHDTSASSIASRAHALYVCDSHETRQAAPSSQDMVQTFPSNDVAPAHQTLAYPMSTQERASPTPSRRQRIACQSCRQAKVRCDASNISGRPCSRCRRLTLDCQLDANFKRVSKRPQVEELSEQVQQLRASLSNRIIQPGMSPLQQNLPPIDETTWETQGLQVGQQHPAHSAFVTPAPHFRTLGQISLGQTQISELFMIFFERYHPYLNILDPSTCPDEYYSNSPLLFWAIICIASRRYESEPTLYSSLSSPFMKLLWSCISAPPYSRYLVQAIVLISVWPFPTSTMWTDLSFQLISSAKAIATQTGLHRPETVQDFSRKQTRSGVAEFQESVKTWAACYIAAQFITQVIGQLPLITFDWTISRACEMNNKYTLPDALRHQLLIQQFSCRVSQVMSENMHNPTGLPAENESSTLLSLLERNYDDLESSLEGCLTETNQICLLCSCLYLRTFYFFERPGSDFRRRGLLKAYEIATSSIMASNKATKEFQFIGYCPHWISRMLINAALILIKVLHSNYAQYIDFETGKCAFNTSLTLMRCESIENNDLGGRATTILSQLWTLYSTNYAKMQREPSLELKTRSSASVLHDSMRLWRRAFGGPGYSRGADSPGSGSQRDMSDSAKEVQLEGTEQALDFTVELEDMTSLWDSSMPSLLPADLDLDWFKAHGS